LTSKNYYPEDIAMKYHTKTPTTGSTCPVEAQRSMEHHLLKVGYDKAYATAANDYDRAEKSGMPLSLPRGKTVFLQTLKSLETFLTDLVEKQMGQSRKSKFYTALIEPYLKKYIEEKQKAEAFPHNNQIQYSDPLRLLPFFMTRELTRLMVVEQRSCTEIARKAANSFVMSFNSFGEATNDELLAMIQLVRTYMLADANIYFKERTDQACGGIVICLKDKAKNLHITKEELLATIPSDRSPYKPMLCEPLKHDNLLDTDGGYLSLKSPILKRPEYAVIRQLEFSASSAYGKEWFKLFNRLQSTKFAINTPFLAWPSRL